METERGGNEEDVSVAFYTEGNCAVLVRLSDVSVFCLYSDVLVAWVAGNATPISTRVLPTCAAFIRWMRGVTREHFSVFVLKESLGHSTTFVRDADFHRVVLCDLGIVLFSCLPWASRWPKIPVFVPHRGERLKMYECLSRIVGQRLLRESAPFSGAPPG